MPIEEDVGISVAVEVADQRPRLAVHGLGLLGGFAVHIEPPDVVISSPRRIPEDVVDPIVVEVSYDRRVETIYRLREALEPIPARRPVDGIAAGTGRVPIDVIVVVAIEVT